MAKVKMHDEADHHRINQLRAENERLREALGRANPQVDGFGRSVVSGGWVTVYFRPGDWESLRDA